MRLAPRVGDGLTTVAARGQAILNPIAVVCGDLLVVRIGGARHDRPVNSPQRRKECGQDNDSHACALHT